jgi:hypothetical protein
MGRTGFSWLRIGSSGGLVRTQSWTLGFHKKAGYILTSWVTISFSINILHHGVSEWVSVATVMVSGVIHFHTLKTDPISRTHYTMAVLGGGAECVDFHQLLLAVQSFKKQFPLSPTPFTEQGLSISISSKLLIKPLTSIIRTLLTVFSVCSYTQEPIGLCISYCSMAFGWYGGPIRQPKCSFP